MKISNPNYITSTLKASYMDIIETLGTSHNDITDCGEPLSMTSQTVETSLNDIIDYGDISQ